MYKHFDELLKKLLVKKIDAKVEHWDIFLFLFYDWLLTYFYSSQPDSQGLFLEGHKIWTQYYLTQPTRVVLQIMVLIESESQSFRIIISIRNNYRLTVVEICIN